MMFYEITIPNLLVLAGVALISIAALGKAAIALTIRRQILAGMVGLSFLAGGIILYLLPDLPANSPVYADGAITALVDAQRDWQKTDITVTAGDRLDIAVTGGEWTYWRGHAMYSMGEGVGYICGETRNPDACVEILPMMPPDMLIGRIGDEIFPIGQGTEITAEQDGTLYLRINDGSTGLYDNDGTLTVRILVRSVAEDQRASSATWN
jgi:hypothetical protein